jgi:hypothetical protein
MAKLCSGNAKGTAEKQEPPARNPKIATKVRRMRIGQRERDKPRQGAVASTLDFFRDRDVGFIDWLDGSMLI